MADIDSKAYWDQRAAELEADLAEEREWTLSPVGRLETLRRLEDEAWNLGDSAKAMAIGDEIRAYESYLEVGDDARFEAEWTREVTIERRAAWNTWAKAHPGAKPVERASHEREVGYRMEALKRAVLTHGL